MGWKEAIASAGEHTGRLTQRDRDLAMLGRILDMDHELSSGESLAFQSMQDNLAAGEGRSLTPKQRKWAEEVDARVRPLRAADVPRGTPQAPRAYEKMTKPLAPPGRMAPTFPPSPVALPKGWDEP